MKALITHFSFVTIGGAERVALKIAVYLREVMGMEVEVLCFDAPDEKKLASQFGLSSQDGIKFTELKSPFGISLQLFRIAHLHRVSRKIAGEFDLCISTYNEQDFGRPALQYVHHPIFESRAVLRKYKIIPRENIIDRYGFLEPIYYGMLDFYSGSEVSARRKNVTLTNSGFMAGILEGCGYRDVNVLYPGFLELEGSVDGSGTKKHQIFSLGRIEPDKHTTELVRLYKVLHEADPSLKLIVCGLAGSADYLAEVKSLIHELNVPVELVLDQDRASVLRMIHESKYYINPKPYEHFGIATVEAIEAGCIPFVHNSGGNREIVSHEVLRFEDAEELGRNFIQLMADEKLQTKIKTGLKSDLEKYSSATFFKLFHEITGLFLKRTGS
jgi:glycosyltransferase involved in cell wall biosynthesis